MTAMYYKRMNLFADTSWYAPVCQSAQSATTPSGTLILHTAIEAVSFLSLTVRICLWGLVRLIVPQAQS